MREVLFAVDIGTTTICGRLMDKEGNVLSENTIRNSQSLYGKDVMARVRASVSGKSGELMTLIRHDLMDLIESCMRYADLELTECQAKIVIAANTVMTHLLMGWDVSGLAESPYNPISMDPVDTEIESMEAVVLPGIGPFVGGDILSGLSCLEDKGSWVFLDLGTNGEICLFDGSKYYVTSTAAGPALEGAGISCGCLAKPGAIYKVEIVGRLCHPFVIKREEDQIWADEVRGLCGSGVISVASELIRNKLVGRDGTFIDEFGSEGFEIASGLFFNQEDMRSLQYAKAAVRAGMEILCKRANIHAEGIERLYLAGNFGKNLDLDDGANIGLIPFELKEKTVAVGNTSLEGAKRFAQGRIDIDRLEDIKSRCELVELGGDPEFQREYISRMEFRNEY